MSKGSTFFSGLVLLIVLTGCGGGGTDDLPSLVPASGAITLDGKPLAHAEITFHPLEGTDSPGASAQSDDNGKFTIRTSSQEGAAVGKYKVTVAKLAKEDGSPLTAEETADSALAMATSTNIIPEQYGDLEQTTLNLTVSDGENASITLELASAPAS